MTVAISETTARAVVEGWYARVGEWERVAALVGVSVSTVRRWMRGGVIGLERREWIARARIEGAGVTARLIVTQ